MNERENLLRTVRFEGPERIPVGVNLSAACWYHYDPDALQDLMEAHPLLFPNFERSEEPPQPTPAPWRQAGERYTDSWSCVWETEQHGLTGTVVEHALADWSDFEDFTPPDPAEQNGWGPIDWAAVERRFERAREAGRLRRGSLRHGHTFLTLMYLRGYQNLLFDMADGDPRLLCLIEMVEEFNAGLVQRFVALGAEWIGYPEDLGMQQGPMLKPDHFRRYIKPVYRRLMAPAREAGCVLHMHSDGDIRVLAEDLLDCGIDALNLQDLVNGIEWIRDNLKGRVCIDLDVDRQRVVPFGTPEEIAEMIGKAVRELGSPEGGLMLHHGVYPGVPLRNIEAVMDAMERYSTYFS
ncbi:MAG: uroporphyrinogen decarboxylase family protein [Candidatus Brocadiia bacterium]